MNKFINKPSLPENKVSTVLLSGEYPEFSKILREDFNIDSLSTEKNKLLSDEIAYHPDCIYVQLNKDFVLIDKNAYNTFVNILTNVHLINGISILESAESVKSPYPNDVKLNVRVIGNKVLCNTKFIDENLKNIIIHLGYELVHCNQGYSACSTIILNDNALITDDITIKESSDSVGLDCLYIDKGSVKLKGFKYGFIGGTCGMIDKNKLAFTGKLDSHSNADLIKSFLNKYNIEYLELTDGALIDIGGIIPLTEVAIY